MKINKIVAAGAAATLAVTSLASVASAKNPRSWGLTYTYVTFVANPVIYTAGGQALHETDVSNPFATNVVQTNTDFIKGGMTEAYVYPNGGRYAVDKDANGVKDDDANTVYASANTNGDTTVDDYDFDAIIPVYLHMNTDAIAGYNGTTPLNFAAYAGALTITVKGDKRVNTGALPWQKSTTLKTNIENIVSNGSPLNVKNVTAAAAVLSSAAGFDTTYRYTAGETMFEDEDDEILAYIPLWYGKAPGGSLMPADFDDVNTIAIVADQMKAVTFESEDATVAQALAKKIIQDNGSEFLRYIADAADTDDIWIRDTTTGTTTGDVQVTFRPAAMYSWKYDSTANENYVEAAGAAAGDPSPAPGFIDAAKQADFDPTLFTTILNAKPEVYYSAIQLTASSTDANANGLLTFYGEQLPNARYTDNTHGGLGVAPTGAPDPTQGNGNATFTPADQIKTGNLLIEQLCKLINGTYVKWNINEATLGERNAWLPKTDWRNGQTPALTGDNTLLRDEIWELATTDAYNSSSLQRGVILGALSNVSGNDIEFQSYNVEDYRVGTLPLGFGGLATEIADYFNKELEGTVTFFLTNPNTATTNTWTWLTGGIPSTEVGLKSAAAQLDPKDIALYLNYNTTTGSLESLAEIDAENLKITFDISNQLDALGGYTIGVVHDVYYGLKERGALYTWKGWEGLWVNKVELAVPDKSDVAGDVTIEDDDVTIEDDDDDVTIEDDDDVTIEDDDDVTIEDDDDITIEDDDDLGDDDIGGEVEIVSGDDDDANPHTGVALAVVPALVAAAAIVVSKKRK